MNSNIVKKGISSSEMNNLFNLFCPTETVFGSTFEGQCIGKKKSLTIIGTNPDLAQSIMINADGNEFSIPVSLRGFENSVDVRCGDSIIVDDVNQKVYLYTNVFELKLKDVSSKIGINKIYDTHSTFQLNTQSSMPNDYKKTGVSNLYSKDLITHKKSSPTIYDSGIVGSEINGYVYIKFKADDEKYFYMGERIVTLEQMRSWIIENDFSILYEREKPVITDITHTAEGRSLLNLQPKEEFSWNIYGLYGEMCVYCHVDKALAKVSAMILE